MFECYCCLEDLSPFAREPRFGEVLRAQSHKRNTIVEDELQGVLITCGVVVAHVLVGAAKWVRLAKPCARQDMK